MYLTVFRFQEKVLNHSISLKHNIVIQIIKFQGVVIVNEINADKCESI